METAEKSICLSGPIPPVQFSLDALRARIERLDTLPSVPAILLPLVRQLELPLAEVDVRKIVDLISHDESIAAQCLRMANSPLFGRRQTVDCIRGAVIALGLSRVRDMAMSCCVLKLLPEVACCIDPRTFWAHSLGVAMVSRRLARRIGFKEPDKAYLAGLLHDLGIIGNLLVLPDEFRIVAQRALSQRIPLDRAETELLGYTHCVVGMMVADHWHLAPDVCEVVRRHHIVEDAVLYRSLNAIVHIADLVCRACGLGYGFNECGGIDLVDSAGWAILAQDHSSIRTLGAARFASEMDMYANEVRRLVGVLFMFER
jgi:putative nucleotidyltransferase with HDIG domain